MAHRCSRTFPGNSPPLPEPILPAHQTGLCHSHARGKDYNACLIVFACAKEDHGLATIGTSPLVPQFTCIIAPFELLMMNQVPVDGRHTAMSVLPSPS